MQSIAECNVAQEDVYGRTTPVGSGEYRVVGFYDDLKIERVGTVAPAVLANGNVVEAYKDREHGNRQYNLVFVPFTGNYKRDKTLFTSDYCSGFGGVRYYRFKKTYSSCFRGERFDIDRQRDTGCFAVRVRDDGVQSVPEHKTASAYFASACGDKADRHYPCAQRGGCVCGDVYTLLS